MGVFANMRNVSKNLELWGSEETIKKRLKKVSTS